VHGDVAAAVEQGLTKDVGHHLAAGEDRGVATIVADLDELVPFVNASGTQALSDLGRLRQREGRRPGADPYRLGKGERIRFRCSNRRQSGATSGLRRRVPR